jgi:hypothetical protein
MTVTELQCPSRPKADIPRHWRNVRGPLLCRFGGNTLRQLRIERAGVLPAQNI